MTTRKNGFACEKYFWNRGFPLVAGVDEAGRGALAGPLVAGAVALSWSCVEKPRTRRLLLEHVRDSKRLSHAQRVEALELIRSCFLAVGTGVVEPGELDAIGLSAANRVAMERAVVSLELLPDVLLIDAFTIESSVPQIGYIDGDDFVLSISAASIVAKVTRDLIMEKLESSCPGYAFSRHRGYGTRQHLEELAVTGPSEVHRRTFAPVRLACEPS